MRGCALFAVILSGCSQTNDFVAYDADALTGYGIPGSPNSEPVVPDAHFRFPPIVASCGARNIREIPATDGITVFRIDVPKSREAAVVSCLKRRLSGVQSIPQALPE